MSMSNNIGSKGRKERRPTNTNNRPGRQPYLPWGHDRNHRNNSPSSPEPSLKPQRGTRMRSNIEKSGLTDGIYANVRMTHSATSIVGCVAQVQVKNGGVYEGILKTFSPKMDIVLEKAHKLDEIQGSIPSKDRLIDTVIFTLNDVVTITATNVELDYANKDTFTDTAISKFNGMVAEKELQPWEADSPGDGSLESLEVDGNPAAKPTTKPGQNGWDAADMFRTNAVQFNVQSSYDPNMPEYTIPLRDDNSKEYREREARAAKLASEIEGSEAYKARIALENGDGDEESKFSAVLRDPPSSSSSGGLISPKYVPPALRRNKGMRTGGRAKSPVVPNATAPTPPSTQASHPPMANQEPEPKVNGDKDEKGEGTGGEKMADANVDSKESKEHSPPLGKGDSRKPPRARDQQIKELREFSSNFKLGENESKERERKGSSHSTSPQPQAQPQVTAASQISSQQQQGSTSSSSPQSTSSHTNTPSPADKAEDKKKSSEQADEKKAELDKISDTVKKSTLNPLAKEFVLNPNAKPFTPKQPIQVSTPPRPNTQSPSMPMMPHQMQPGLGQPIYPQMYVPVSMSQQVMQQPQQQQARFPAKRAVVSVRPDFNSAAAQAVAATGQPLLAQTMPQQPQYMPYHVTPSGTVPQMMPVPQARMVGPNQMGQPGHPGQDPQVQQGQAQPVYMTGAQAVPAHLQHHPGAGPTPPHQTSHMTSHQAPQSATPQHNQQPSHIASQAGAHPAQSPVQPQAHPGHHQQQPHHPATAHHQQHQQHHQQQQQPQHHPTSHHPAAAAAAAAAAGQHQHHVVTSVTQQQHPNHPQAGHQPNTPTQQPHLIYPNPQMTQPPHPPLQPSPHTPTSPQSMHHQQLGFAPPFSYTTPTGVQAGPQLSYTHNNPHTTVTHAHHQQHTHAPQIIMMPPHQGQMTPTGGPPTHMHGPPQGPIMQAGPVHGQAGPHMVPQSAMSVASSNMHPQIHYMSHHPQKMSFAVNSQHPPPLQAAAYQHSQ